ncbi:DNA cytosine methyltransferase [Collimonas pratensis]|uniref:C-5 cytosine-specific DNA methylase family protein n=1 Tax=Collimonas pratensis TaxID=279113 RepID=A0ABM5Z3S4_9BURK|nr:DNA cytosine methyltransferase [Collimonas pratensis]AMP13703.1 C-5 cytosine-specific DNA methylase family protein [Collimonas pratensis]
MIIKEIKHFHLFGAIGGGAKGFNRGKARLGNMVAKFRCIGSVDVDAAANRDFERLVGVKATTLDMFDRDQYVDFNDRQPPPGWREATTADIKRAAGGESPNIIFLSAPCKGFSGLLAENKSKTAKYQALNRLTLRGIWLALEAFADDPAELIVFENVPRIQTRGRHLLDQIVQLLQRYGYAVAETTHDCGELGGLAQSRKRFLLVARHQEKVPPFLYEPEKKTLKSVGSILERMPLPGDLSTSPMHRIPSLQWKTWVRLAFVEAGGDWRSLNKLAVENGNLRDYLIVPESHGGFLGVRDWNEPMGTVTSRGTPTCGAFSIADPRAPADALQYQQYGVRKWDEPTGTVTGQRSPIQGGISVADPRAYGGDTHKNVYRVTPWEERAGTVTAGHGPSSGGGCVADPRHTGPEKHSNEFHVTPWRDTASAVTSAHGSGQCVADPRPGWDRRGNNLMVMNWDNPSHTVIAGGKGVQGGWMSVADPRTGMNRGKGDNYLTGGHYGVIPWDSPSGAVSSSAGLDNGRWSVADRRVDLMLPAADKKLITVIRSLDGTWHRPFTTLELAALQSLIEPEEHFELAGLSDSDWRERIGNAVPPDAAEAIAGVMGVTLLLAWSGETFVLSSLPIWVQPVAIAISLAQVE